nr:RodZ domain-containing protein [uncultured Rhodoferax sp.]
MSEAESTTVRQEESDDVDITFTEMTAGRLLRNAREAAGLHIAALAVSMKVPVKKLEALEADRVDLLPDAVFVRALASSVCRTLKIDSTPILQLLPQSVKPSFEGGDKGINAPFKVPGEAGSMRVFDAMKRPVVIVVALLLAAALGVGVLPDMHLPGFEANTDATPPSVAPANDSLVESVPVLEKQEDKLPPVEVVPAPSEPLKTPEAVADAVITASSAPVLKAADLIVIRAKAVTWVEVVDATGNVLVRRTLQPDGVTSATGVTPLAVVIGKADAVEVEVRGRPFGLTAISKDNVARFEVK